MSSAHHRLGGILAALALVLTAASTEAAVAKTTAKKTTKKAAKPKTTKPASKTTRVVGPVEKGTLLFGTIGTSVSATTGARTTDETRKIAEAWATLVNREGGINGYKVKILFEDGRADTARTLQAVKTLDSKGVLAIAGQTISTTIAGSLDYLAKNKIPVIGGSPNIPEFETHPMLFPISTNFTSAHYGLPLIAKQAGAKYFRNFYCTEVAACGQSAPLFTEIARREGLKADSRAASAVATDYTSFCIDAKQDGVEFAALNGVNPANFVRDCVRQNFHPIYAVGGAANQGTIDSMKGERLMGQLTEFGVFYDGPEVQRFKKAITLTDLNNTVTPPTQTSVQTWLGLEMAGAVMKKLTAADPTRAQFLDALYSIKGEDLDGQIAPVDYTTQRTGRHANTGCWTQHLVQDGKLFHMNAQGQIVNKLTFICEPNH